ncbi:MAG: hypothetical protein ACTSU4_15040 [Promethearchaeota archaeon]
MKENEIKEIAKIWFMEGINRAHELKKWSGLDSFFEKVWLEKKVGIERLIKNHSEKNKKKISISKAPLEKVKVINTKVKDFIQKNIKKE